MEQFQKYKSWMEVADTATVSGSTDLSVVRVLPLGSELRAVGGSTGSVIDVLSSFTGEKYVTGDIVTPSPSGQFWFREFSISLQINWTKPS